MGICLQVYQDQQLNRTSDAAAERRAFVIAEQKRLNNHSVSGRVVYYDLTSDD